VGARRLRNESFFNAPQLKRDSLGITTTFLLHWVTGRKVMQLQLTAVFEKVRQGYIAFVEELPGANTQGASLEEARKNLPDAVHLVPEHNRRLAGDALGGRDVTREPLRLPA